MMTKISSAKAVAEQIQDDAVIAIGGNCGGMVEADYILEAIEARFLDTGHPRNLTIVHSLGIGDCDRKGTNRFAHEVMLKRVIGAHFSFSPRIQELIQSEKVEAYCFPAGAIQGMLREIGAGRPGLITHVGLDTFVDPRQDGGRANGITKGDLVELIEIDGEEKLRYKPFKVDFAIIRGTFGDSRGNISFEEEAIDMDAYTMALAAHNSGGKVFVQVRDLVEDWSLEPRRVTIPGVMVDAVVEHSSQEQTYLGGYDLSISGQRRRLLHGDKLDTPSHPLRRLIAKRAAQELEPGASLNLGFGIPAGISGIAAEQGILKTLWMSIEQGVHNGAMLDGPQFGCSRNAEALLSSIDQFDYYSGKGIDIAFLGMGEIDQLGNVNVSHLGGKLIGPGGFIDIAQNARKIVFCGTFDAKGSQVEVSSKGLKIIKPGLVRKLLAAVDKITFSGKNALKFGQKVIYITERAVFELTEEGVALTEVAPGIDIQRDIIPYMGFNPIVSNPKEMDRALFD